MYTLQGKTRSTRHTLFTLDLHMVLDPTSHMVRVDNLSLVPTRTKQTSTPGRSIGDQRQTDMAVILSRLILLPHDSLGAGKRGFSQVVTQLHQLTGPILPACEGYHTETSEWPQHSPCPSLPSVPLVPTTVSGFKPVQTK
jgi:hypothetical protein